VFIASKDMRITFQRSSNFTLDGNVFYAGSKVRFEIGDNFDWKGNIIYSGSGKVENVLLDMSGNGTVTKSASDDPPGDTIMADPGFVDFAGGDYRFKPDGVAGKLGLKGVDAKLAGRENKPGA
jgi:hypothetical protein